MTTPFLPSPLYFIQQPLQQVIHDKDDGSLLAGGRVEYYSDPQFNEPKNVFEVSNAPDGTYYFSNIGSVLTLSSIGSFVDLDGNNFTPMLFPWTGSVLAPDQFEPYYIRVYSATDILQFTVTGYPFNNFSIASLTEEGGDTSNQITNPQFVEALIPAAGITITVSGAMTIPVAPSWFIDVSGAGTIFLQQEPLDIQTPSDAPFALTIRTTSDTSGTLYQRITNSPRLLFEETISGYLEINSATAFALTMSYVPSGGTGSADIITESVPADNEWTPLRGAVVIEGTANANPPGVDGYVDIEINIPTLANFMITSIQVEGVADVNVIPNFHQISTPLQESQLFYYWQEWLNYKPIPSYLVGWDFPMNPAQPNGDSGDFVTNPTASNKSAYAWDQTILFASVGGQLTYDRNSSTKGITIGTGAATSFAMIQYLPVQQARELLAQRNSVSIQGFLEDTNPDPATSISGTVSLWWTTGALPDLKDPNFNSLVTVVTSAGVPTTIWTQVPNIPQGNNAPFSFGVSSLKAPIYLSGWDATLTNASTTADYIAIVVAFSTIETTQTVTVDFCGLFGGDIATRPAPQTQDEVLKECQYYYETTYDVGTKPGTVSADGQQSATQTFISGGGDTKIYPSTFEISFNSIKLSTTPALTMYNPGTGLDNYVLSKLYYGGSPTASANSLFSGSWDVLSRGQKSIQIIPINNTFLIDSASSGSSVSGFILYHYTIDSRLGQNVL